MKSDRWECGQCGYQPVDGGHPSILTCPACKGDMPWRPLDQETMGLIPMLDARSADSVATDCGCPCHREGDENEFRCCISYPSLCDRPRGWHLSQVANCGEEVE
jgi:hypothetical protein